MFEKLKEDVREILTGSTPENDLRARLHADHKEIDEVIRKFLVTEACYPALRTSLRNDIVALLTAHARAEEDVVYAAFAEAPQLVQHLSHATAEHSRIDALVSMLGNADPNERVTINIVNELRDAVRHHVKEEEGTLLPAAEKALGATRLTNLIPEFEARRETFLQLERMARKRRFDDTLDEIESLSHEWFRTGRHTSLDQMSDGASQF